MSLNEHCTPSPECMTRCPAILRAVEEQGELEARQDELVARQASCNQGDLGWDLAFAAAAEQDMRDNDMWRRRDMHDTFRHIGETQIAHETDVIKTRQDRLDRKTAARLNACQQGPSKKYVLWGETICRSAVEK